MILTYRNNWKPLVYGGSEPASSVKGQLVNIFGFCKPYSLCGNYSKTKMNEHDCVPIKTLFTKASGSQVWPGGSSLLTPGLYHNNFKEPGI